MTGFTKHTLAALVVAVPLFASSLARADADPKIMRTWKANCASCHGADGKAKTEKGDKMKMADMSDAAWQKKFTDAQIHDAIVKGVSETRGGVKKEMDPYKDKVKADQIPGLIALIRSFK